MAMIMDQDQPQTYKHYCRVCKKGFGCGRALGGHMRAHGVNDDYADADQEEEPSSGSAWAEDDPPSNKRMYALRTNPNRQKSCRVCENCGKEFVSWKSFLEHGKCSSDDDEDVRDSGDQYYVTSPASDADEEGQFGNWSKGKRTRRMRSAMVPVSSEDEDLANCLMLLSSARGEPVLPVFEPEEPTCASASKTPIMLQVPSPMPKGMFECKACKKVFTSHQALGGHRASHKKVKGCFAAKLDDLDEIPPQEEEMVTMNDNSSTSAAAAMTMAIVPFNNTPLAVTPLNNKRSKVHECSICHRQFASGQALGGHKRCHWITSSNNTNNISSSSNLMEKTPNPHQNTNSENQNRRNVLTLRPMIIDMSSSERLDLNMPPSMEIGSPLRLDLQPSWVDDKNISNMDITSNNIDNNNTNDDDNKINASVNNENMNNVDDEVDSKVNLAKLTELKDTSEGGEVNWLQVGIGSSGNVNDGSE